MGHITRVDSTSGSSGLRARAAADRVPPELFFVVTAISQYTGAVIAKRLFTEVAPGTVVWFRVLTAALMLVLVTRPWQRTWTRQSLRAAAVFGIATAVMNLFFYLAISRINLGIGVAIEFIGPITVAAVRTRTSRNWVALSLAAIGVLLLAGLQFSVGDPVGVLLMLGASACWAGYIVFGSRMAKSGDGAAGLGVGLILGAVVIAPFGVGGSPEVFASGRLLLLCACVGMFSSAIGYGLDQLIHRRISTRRFAVLSALLPMTAVLAGVVFLDERLHGLDVVGVLLVVAAVLLQEREPASTDSPAGDPALVPPVTAPVVTQVV
jgi:inner membrane transporter RhtA